MADDDHQPIKQLAADYRAVFSTEEGKRVLEDLGVFAGLQADGFAPGDPHLTAYNAGRRSVALRILEMLEMSSLDFQKLAHDRFHSMFETE